MPTPTNAKKSKITKRTQLSHVDSASCLGRALQFAGLPIRAKYELGRRSRVAEGKERVNVVNIVNMENAESLTLYSAALGGIANQG